MHPRPRQNNGDKVDNATIDNTTDVDTTKTHNTTETGHPEPSAPLAHSNETGSHMSHPVQHQHPQAGSTKLRAQDEKLVAKNQNTGKLVTENPLILAIQGTANKDKAEDEKLVYKTLNDIKIKKKFLEIDQKAALSNGMTPLQFAVFCGNKWAVRWLLNKEEHHEKPFFGGEIIRDPGLCHINEHGSALQIAVSYQDFHEDKEIKGDKQSKRDIINILLDAHDKDKFQDKTYLAPIIESAYSYQNVYFLDKYLSSSMLSEESFKIKRGKLFNFLSSIIEKSLEDNQSNTLDKALCKFCSFICEPLGLTIDEKAIGECIEKWIDKGIEKSNIESLNILFKYLKKIDRKSISECIKERIKTWIERCVEKNSIQSLEVLLNNLGMIDKESVETWIKICIEKENVESLRILLIYIDKITNKNDCIKQKSIDAFIDRIAEKGNMDMLHAVVDSLPYDNTFIACISSVLEHSNEGKIDKQKAISFLLSLKNECILITYLQNICESHVFNDEEKLQLLLHFCQKEIFLYSEPQLFEEQLREMFIYIMSLNNAKLINELASKFQSQTNNKRRGKTNKKIKDKLGSEQQVDFICGPNKDLFMYCNYNYREKFFECLRNRATKGGIKNIESLKLLLATGIINSDSKWDYQAQSGSSDSKSVIDLLNLQKYIFASANMKEEALEDAITTGKRMLDGMNPENAELLLNPYKKKESNVGVLAATLLGYLRTILSKRGATTTPSAPPQPVGDEKVVVVAANSPLSLQLVTDAVDRKPPPYEESLSEQKDVPEIQSKSEEEGQPSRPSIVEKDVEEDIVTVSIELAQRANDSKFSETNTAIPVENLSLVQQEQKHTDKQSTNTAAKNHLSALSIFPALGDTTRCGPERKTDFCQDSSYDMADMMRLVMTRPNFFPSNDMRIALAQRLTELFVNSLRSTTAPTATSGALTPTPKK